MLVARTFPVIVRTVTLASSGTDTVKSTEPGKLRGRGNTVRTSTRFACSVTWMSIICISARAAFGFGRCTRLIASIVISRPVPPVMVMLPLMFVRSMSALVQMRRLRELLGQLGLCRGRQRDGRGNEDNRRDAGGAPSI